jgi:hypothetical protein
MKGSYQGRMEDSVVANREAKPHGLIFLHEDAKQLPWKDILAEKHRGAGGHRTATLVLGRFTHEREEVHAQNWDLGLDLDLEKDRCVPLGLILVNGAGLSGHPIGLLQFDAPEMGSRGDKFDAHALALLGVVAEIDHSAFLLFLRGGIGEND